MSFQIELTLPLKYIFEKNAYDVEFNDIFVSAFKRQRGQ